MRWGISPRRLVVAALGVSLTMAVATPAAAAVPDRASTEQAATLAALPPYVQWVADVTTVAGQARSYLNSRLPDGAIRPAIVLDIDNTALQTSYRPGLLSPATGPVLEVARQATAAGAAVFFVTARPEILDLQTEFNLDDAGYTWVDLYSRPWFDGRSDQQLKTDARIAIEGRGYRIVANIGNNTSDLAGGHAERTFKLPDYDGQLA